MSLTNIFIDKAADAQADIEELVERYSEQYGNRMLTLMLDPTQREEPLWQLFGVPIEISLLDYAAVEIFDRDPYWVAEVSTLVAAARAQAYWEIYGVDLFELTDRNSSDIKKVTDKMTKAELQEAAKVGVSRESIDGAKARRANA